jgi:serine protease AprX
MTIATSSPIRRLKLRLFSSLVVLLALASPRIAPAGVAEAVSAPTITPSLLAQMQATPLQRLPIILEMKAASPPFSSGANVLLAQQALSILSTYAQGFGGLPIINGAAGAATAAEIQAMSLLPQVGVIEQDAIVGPRRPSTSKPRPGAPLSSLDVREVKADRVWSEGVTGRGITVAVLDSGVALDLDLNSGSNRVVASVNFACATDPAHPDDGGHGTHVAGTIAGDGTKSAGQFVGIAPRANIVDVKVLDGHGRGRVSSVLAGLQWVLEHKAQYNIRIVNLSLGATPQGSSYRSDPMAAAVETAWRKGLTVVAAAGNTGPTSGGVETPGIDPYVVTVGSTDDQVTLPLGDDLLAWFSAWGTPTNSTPKPDLVAPGRQIVAPRVVGSVLDLLLPDHVVTASNGATYFRLTGTSMSTPVVAGTAALMLERRPALTPDQVKALLATNTQPFGWTAAAPPPGAAGAGLLNAYQATSASLGGTANQGLRPADGFARLLYPILYGQPLVWKDPSYLGQNWTTLTWATLEWAAPAWDNIAWDNIAWDNIAWDNIAWDNIAWDNIAWDNIAWDNIAWDSGSFD